MKEVSSSNFGLLIAYMLPGFVALVGVSFFSETVTMWLVASPQAAPTVGGFLYVTVASLAAGLIVSTVRWVIVDSIHHRTGIRQSSFDFSQLQKNVAGFTVLVDDLYRYYQFYSGMFIATAFAYCAFILSTSSISAWSVLGFIAIECILWFGSRDTLCKYYCQGAMLLGETIDILASAKEKENRLLNAKVQRSKINAVPLVSKENPGDLKRRTFRKHSIAEKLQQL